ncbi:UbiE/COQ5 family methyltransferase [Clostridium pasteurianum DSM 525 = ATCC 6013]|uniref:Methyltransferase type 11 n=1 Tax=Clostridium pasteurianum DSM 525 = ATCC 6013 TaxID=1262449 RepID=A0A0H3J499_CLOPA|nr:class I SAM-dependent methyltransferase [Clostridium pasteurianum]AJA48304.1 UbiE/COQ5 family methyltransferase [Clostridium pasteurianum DSM 525 = ATCC 6013]AJA52292.1 UbiE/COQ5 family methyltransferase [Clostridium pasteurianum DSM 525 = ATCC 6013]AOZ75556.1 SAM-dependent methyltransferase [Clostridium pasteurianum DSM 525 = ATCC 6013]AOZ79351.1 SAM-dependent methyltransferase [Clostridium pasteurianum]ELP60546.1 methyltransferase [Clostridium pasteurianum DSM 525 = ATCC 6013]
MSDMAKRLNQCRKPAGDTGKVVVEDMNESHFELTGWGLRKVNIQENSKILDIGCGGGRTINRLASLTPKGKVFGIDYSIDCVNWASDYNKDLVAQGKVEIYNATVEKLPFEDEKFDFVSAVETIYFWPDVVDNLKEIKRVLKPSGKILVINEIYKDEKFKDRNDEYVKMGNLKIYTPKEFEELFKKAGYRNVQIEIKEEKNWICSVAEK